MKQILMIINPRAGRSKPFEPLLQAMSLLSGHGWNLRVRLTAASGDATRIAREEGDGCDVCIAVGGDGTLNEVAAGLLELEHPPLLGYFPQGSTNDFAATLKIPGDPPAAAWAILNGEERRMDVGSWNGRSFLYVASFGAFTRSSYTAPQSVKNALGHAAYILEGVKEIRLYFGGVQSAVSAWINGTYMTRHLSGYTSFVISIVSNITIILAQHII